MDNGSTVLLAALAIVATSVTAMAWTVKFVLGKLVASIEANTHATEKQSETNSEVGKAVEDLGSYIRQHNGRQSEIHNETMESFKLINEKLREGQGIADERDSALQKFMGELKEQHVSTQHVDKQIVHEDKK